MGRVFSIAALLILALATVGCYLAGTALSAPALRAVGAPPPDLKARNVEFDGVKGWFVAAHEGAPCVLLMHGVRADRRSMIERARFLRQAGYSSLLFDFQAHGESPGEHITFGYRESANASAAVAVLRRDFKCAKVAAIGVSLGGAAALLGTGPIDVDALILESVYPTIDEAVADRLQMRFGRAGAILAPILTMQLKPRLGVASLDLQPIRQIAKFYRPLLIMHGTKDRHTSLKAAERLFAAANDNKEFWAIHDAAHVDLQQFAPAAYRERLLNFLFKHLGTPDKPFGPTP